MHQIGASYFFSINEFHLFPKQLYYSKPKLVKKKTNGPKGLTSQTDLFKRFRIRSHGFSRKAILHGEENPGGSRMKKRISIIIPVYKETLMIQECINHLAQLSLFEAVEIIIVDGETDGKTIASVLPGDIIKAIGPKGRATQMNTGAFLATGDILLFLHVDTRLPQDAISSILSEIRPNHIGGGAFNLEIQSKGLFFRLIESGVRIRTRVTRTPYGDQAIFIKKRIFDEIGGFPDIPIMEDVTLVKRLKKNGKNIAIIPACVKTSARRWHSEGRFYCILRNRLLMLLYLAGVPPHKLAKFYPPQTLLLENKNNK